RESMPISNRTVAHNRKGSGAYSNDGSAGTLPKAAYPAPIKPAVSKPNSKYRQRGSLDVFVDRPSKAINTGGIIIRVDSALDKNRARHTYQYSCSQPLNT